MQNSKRSKADSMIPRSINGMEFNCMFEFVALKQLMERALRGEFDPNCPQSMMKYDNLCKDIFARMPSLKGVSWTSIHFPFGLSLDHAPFHQQFRLRMLTPRVDLLEEFGTVFEAAERELGIDKIADETRIRQACEELRAHAETECAQAPRGSEEKKAAAARKETVKRTIENVDSILKKQSPLQFLVSSLCGGFSSSIAQQQYAKHIAQKCMAEYKVKNAAFGDADTCWEEIFRRRMAVADPRWR